MSGRVFDPSGAAVPNAKIEVLNVATNETTTATTDAGGAYTIPLLRAGAYKVTVTVAGFKQVIRDKVTVEAAQALGLDFKLEVGAVTQTVEVTADAVVLETMSAARSGIVSARHVADMPLNARNPYLLGSMMAGVNFNGAAIWQRPFDNGAIAEWSMNGGRNSSSEYMMDGASNDGQMGGNNIAYVPIVEAVQEFNVMMNMYSSEYGKTGSGIMNVVLKTGGATHHGTIFENMRRTALDANMFQNNAVGTKKSTHYLDQYGFQAEGPVSIPKLLKKDGNVRLFYMGALELYREGTPNPLSVSYPEPEMRTGDFSKLVNATGQKVTIYDPLTATYDANGNVTKARDAFLNNIIPPARITAVAQAVTKFMPLPNRPAPAGSAYSTNNVYLPDYFDKDKFYSMIMKFDWNFGDKHRAFIRHASNDRTEDRAGNGIDNAPGTDGQQPFQRINDAYVIDWVRTLSPTLIMNVRGSYNRFIEKGYGRANAGFDLTKLGISPSLIAQLPNADMAYFGRWTYGYTSLGRGQSNNYTNTYQLMGSVTKVAGSHNIKAGMDARQINYELQNSDNIMEFGGANGFTQSAYSSPAANTGNAYASFLMGMVSGTVRYPLFPWWRTYYVAGYVQDDWRVTRRLTLNLGLRLDFFSPQFEKWGRQNGPFDPNIANPISPAVAAYVATLTIPANVAPLYAKLATMKGGLTFAKGPGLGGSPYPWLKWNPQPRVGFAYQIGNKLVLRGGFAEYMSNPSNDYYRNSGYTTSTDLVNSLDGGRTPITNIFSNPFPDGIRSPTGSSAGAATFVGQNPGWFDPGFVAPSKWDFSAGFQYQVSSDIKVDASYVGSRSYNLNMSADYNNIPLSVRDSCNPMKGGDTRTCSATYPNPFKGIDAFRVAGSGWYTANTTSYYNLNRQFPQFSGALTQYGRNDSWIHYNAMQVNVYWRARNGLNILANYTLSKQIEEWGLNDPLTNTYQVGPYFLDRPQVIKVTAIAPLPFGEGQKWGSGTTGLVKKLISGWEGTMFMLDPLSGYPMDLPGNVVILKDPRTPGGDFTGKIDWKAYRVRHWNPCALKWYDSTSQYPQGYILASPASVAVGCTAFDSRTGSTKFPDDYAWLQVPSNNPRYTPYRSGNIRKHHAVQMDVSLLKTTKINERLSFQFGVEAFNFLNHNYFGRTTPSTNPDNNLDFGAVTPGNVASVNNQNIQPRFIQIRIKFFW